MDWSSASFYFGEELARCGMVKKEERRAAEAEVRCLEFFPQVVAPDGVECFFSACDHRIEVVEIRHGAEEMDGGSFGYAGVDFTESCVLGAEFVFHSGVVEVVDHEADGVDVAFHDVSRAAFDEDLLQVRRPEKRMESEPPARMLRAIS